MNQDAQLDTDPSDSAEYDIAVLSAVGRFPGAANVDEFWRNLCEGVESIRAFSRQEMIDAGTDPAVLDDPAFVAAHGMLDDIDRFDAEFFGFTPREAALLDPQQRLLLELGWNALEQAGHGDASDRGRVGVFAGAGTSGYEARARAAAMENSEEAGDALSVSLGNASDFLPLWLSYKLDLRGPSVNVQTSCSTGLAAIHLACQSLLQHECDLALAGGVSIAVPQQVGYRYQEGSILSPDGHCRPFDQDARGTVGGSGAGLVVLRRLPDAIADGDPILGVIKGSAMNNDGAGKIGFTAPSIDGQAEVVSEALAVAHVEPSTLGYVETHGTGTPLGDPIEIAALRQAFEQQHLEQQGSDAAALLPASCAIGSVKSNVGHLDRAAGVVGFLKALLAVHHGALPPSLHFTAPNPRLQLEQTPFRVQTELQPWPADKGPRRAGVSSFGMGGTNVHAIVEQAPAVDTSASRPGQVDALPVLVVLSAGTSRALDERRRDLDAHLQRHPDLQLADIAYTLQRGRRRFDHRAVFVAGGLDETLDALASEPASPWSPGSVGHGRLLSRRDSRQQRDVAFLFPGQGAQYPGLGSALHALAEYRGELATCAEILRDDLHPLLPDHGGDLVRLLEDVDADAALLARTEITQPLLFSVEYALARQWMAWGVRPSAMLGHSIGEYVAACLAGVFRLEDALKLVALRGRLMASLPPGSMLTVPLPEEELTPYLDAIRDAGVGSVAASNVEIAAVNGPGVCVATGETAAIDALCERLETDGLECRRLHTSHAFHSAMMEPILDPFREAVARVERRAPGIRFLSNLTGTWITDDEATDPDYWARHLRSTVRFADGLRELLQDPELLLLEVGPGRTLTTLARQIPQSADAPERLLVACMPTPKEALEARREQANPEDASKDRTSRDGYGLLLRAVGEAWLTGVEIDWQSFAKSESRQGTARPVSLPGYPFADQRHWIDLRPGAASTGSLEVTSTAAAQAVPEKQADPANWFYLPVLQETAPLVGTENEDATASWLLLAAAERSEEADQLGRQLEAAGHSSTRVQLAEEAVELVDGTAQIRPLQREDFSALVQQLAQADRLPERVLYLPAPALDASSSEGIETEVLRLYYPVIYLAQALSEAGEQEGVRIGMVVHGVLSVSDADPVSPALSTLIAPSLVLPQELSGLHCRLLDAPRPETGVQEQEAWARRIVHELQVSSTGAEGTSQGAEEALLALRGHRRWRQRFEAIHLAAPSPRSSSLRSGATYLITDGVSPLGLMLAEAVAASVTGAAATRSEARLALLIPGEFPPASDWKRVLADTEDTPLRQAVQRLQALVDRGVEIFVTRASCKDADDLQRALDEARGQLGRLHGIFHAEHSPGAGLVALRSAETAVEVLRPRTSGTENLVRLLAGEPVETWVLCSSIAGVMGGFGLLDHAASACYLDACSATLRQRFPNARVLTLDWGPSHWEDWQEALITAAPELREQLRESRLSFGLSIEEGAEVLRRALASDLPRLIVSTQNLHAAIRNQLSLAQMQNQTGQLGSGQLGTGASAEHVAPRDEVEEEVAAVWLELFGVPRIGINDDFFEIGGHSLLAIQVVSRLRKRLQVELPMPILFEAPTISQLAEHVRAQQGQQQSLAEVEAMLAEIEGLSLDEVRAELDTSGAGQEGQLEN